MLVEGENSKIIVSFDLSESSNKSPSRHSTAQPHQNTCQHYCHFNFSLWGNTTPYWIRSWLQLPQCTFEPRKHCLTSLCMSSIVNDHQILRASSAIKSFMNEWIYLYIYLFVFFFCLFVYFSEYFLTVWLTPQTMRLSSHCWVINLAQCLISHFTICVPTSSRQSSVCYI